MKKIFLLFFILTSTISCSQNLITNYSMEDTIPCATNPNLGGPETSPPWFASTGSPDYIYLNYCVNGAATLGFQLPSTGNGMIGIAVFSTFSQFDRELFSQQLTDTLKNGHAYCVSFKVSLAGQVKYASDGLNVLFTSFSINDSIMSSFSLTPQIRNPVGNIITDTLNWTLISGTFTAQGGEKYITIGNLLNDANTQIDTMPWGNPSPAYAFSYYYIDDISVIDCTVGINQITASQIKFTLSPNPVKNKLTVQLQNTKEKITAIEITNSLGQKVFEKTNVSSKLEIDVSFLQQGVYFVKVFGEKGVGVKKFIKE